MENSKEKSKKPSLKPLSSPEARENRCISMAMDLVEKRLKEGTASSQETTFFLKLGSTKAKLENEILKEQKKMITAKTEEILASKRYDELFDKAIRAMRLYKGEDDGDDREEL